MIRFRATLCSYAMDIIWVRNDSEQCDICVRLTINMKPRAPPHCLYEVLTTVEGLLIPFLFLPTIVVVINGNCM